MFIYKLNTELVQFVVSRVLGLNVTLLENHNLIRNIIMFRKRETKPNVSEEEYQAGTEPAKLF